jgi:asparagine synthase (glutamine-hydrolysing)
LQDAIQAGRTRGLNEEDAFLALQQTLSEAIRDQLIADVPLGALLSGGIDSSLVVALMQQQSSSSVRTFTIGFANKDYSEAGYARAIAQHLGTEHTELILEPLDALNIIPRLPTIYDEPFADSSQIPSCLVAQLARQQVTVALSGDGGDELFGGYNRYLWAPQIWNIAATLPRGLRDKLLQLLSTGCGAGKVLNVLLPGRMQVAFAGEKQEKLRRSLQDANSLEELYQNLLSDWRANDPLVKYADTSRQSLPGTESRLDFASDAERLMYFDSVGYLPDDILTKVDRAAMAVGLETRVPFLDHRVIELAWQLPMRMKIRGGQGKWALRQLLQQHVPVDLVSRPKQGFSIPLADWLRGPLRDWAEALISPTGLEQAGYLHGATVMKKWQEHQSGKTDWHNALWSVLMFQAWLQESGAP